MDFEYSDKMKRLCAQMREFMDEHVIPANRDFIRDAERGSHPMGILDPLKELAREAGFWNLFLPGLHKDEPGTRLTNLEYAPLAEITGEITWSPEVFNCNAPDTGNMELLHLFASTQQREHWLEPLLQGEIRSCFAMTEPDVASSDATNIRTSIRREGNEYVINGRKWFATGALHPHCRLFIVIGLDDELADAQPHERHSMMLVSADAPGLEIVRNVPIMHHLASEGHCEIVLRNVRVPLDHVLGYVGGGFAMAQARLGPGRVHHCMRTIGQCELALQLMCERALERKTFGKHLADFANVQEWIAQSRVEIDQARLLVLRAAWKMDREGNAAARTDVSAIKLVAARLQTEVLDRAIQVFGAMGLTPDTPLAYLWTWGRAVRFLDGPDEVHLRTLARTELSEFKGTRGTTAKYYNIG